MEDKKVIGRLQDPKERVTNFEEVEFGYNDKEALAEANRCLQCVNPRCMQGCPVSIHIPEFIKAIREGNLKEAYELLRSLLHYLPYVEEFVHKKSNVKQCVLKD